MGITHILSTAIKSAAVQHTHRSRAPPLLTATSPVQRNCCSRQSLEAQRCNTKASEETRCNWVYCYLYLHESRPHPSPLLCHWVQQEQATTHRLILLLQSGSQFRSEVRSTAEFWLNCKDYSQLLFVIFFLLVFISSSWDNYHGGKTSLYLWTFSPPKSTKTTNLLL